MRLRNRIGLAALPLLFCLSSFAAQITGTVTNGTTNKPASADPVALLSLAGGMDEVAHGKTDAQGHFSLDAPGQSGPFLVRVEHQGASYFKQAPPGTTTADLTIYDTAKSVSNLIGEGRVFRFQTVPGGQLEVSEMFILRNESSPPRTQMGERSFEFELPEGAQIADAMAEGPGGMPTNTPPVPAGKKNRYGFAFPIRPGRTRFQVSYRVPYAGTREFKITPNLPLAELGVMMPKSMQFNSTGQSFNPAQEEEGMSVFVAKSLSPGKEVEFSVSGEGSAPQQGQGTAQQPQDAGRPGGGLGAPNEGPDPLSGSRWYIITIFAVVLAGGGYWLFRMQRTAAHASPGGGSAAPPRNATKGRNPQPYSGSPSRAGSFNGNGGGMLDALKEELFQLESDRLQGKISQSDYEASKGGIETLMRRQLRKK